MWLAQKGNKGPYSRGYGFFQWSCMDVRVGLCKKAEHRRIDASELWCWRRLLKVPWTARRSALGFLGKNDAKAETPVLWPPHAKS